MPSNYDGGPYRRKAQFTAAPGRDQDGPCAGCRHVDQCREGLACRSLELFVEVGRFSEYAPRQPSRAIYKKLFA